MDNLTDCPFCLPTVNKACFAESENFRAIYNIAPIYPGHCLVIPKKHIIRFIELPDCFLAEWAAFTRKIMLVIDAVFHPDGFDFSLQDGPAAGQTVMHTHGHIIPRYMGDAPDPGDWYPRLLKHESDIIDSLARPQITEPEMHRIVEKLKAQAQKMWDANK